jgi:hypothetical protein
MKFKLVSKVKPILKVISYWGLLGLVVLLSGFIMVLLDIPFGSTLCSIGFFVFILPTIAFSVVNMGGSFIRRREILENEVDFNANGILIGDNLIPYDTIKEIEAVQLEYRGQPSFAKYNPLFDGTGNRLIVSTKDSEKIEILFYVEHQEDIRQLQLLLSEIKIQNKILLIK